MITEKTLALISRRKELKVKNYGAKSERLSNRHSRKYSEMHKEVKKKVREDKRNYFENLAKEEKQAVEVSEVYRRSQ